MKTLLSIIVLAASLLAPALIFADTTPVVIAIDTSRSLSTSDLATIQADVSSILDQMPADTPLGLIAFNDTAEWLAPVPSSRDTFNSALYSMAPAGSFTVFHDALFLAVRQLPNGGVILVATDGRDENSATTVDDVARLCDENHTRILSAGVGRGIDERALRRFAMLSNGHYLGRLHNADPAEVASTITEAAINVEADLIAAIPPTPLPVAIQAAPSTVQQVSGTSGIPTWFYALVPLVIFAIFLAWFLVRRGSNEPQGRLCERCDTRLEPWETSCSQCEMVELEDAVNSTRVAESAVQDESVLDPAVFEKSPVPLDLDQTLVLDEQPVLVTKQRGKPPRTYTLPRSQIFAVGRAPEVNTLTLDDPTISGQHFKVVPKDGDFYVVDLGATNGTSVNHERIKVRKLAPGDVIRVGLVEFEFKMKIRRMG